MDKSDRPTAGEEPLDGQEMLSDAVAKRLSWLLIIAVLLLAVGLSTPVVTISQFIFLRNSFSVLSGIYELLTHGQIILFLIVALFSVVLPIMKIWVLFRIVLNRKAHSSRIRRYLHLMHDYGRWSMLDVMVVAMLIVTVKLGTIATIQVHFGLYLFAAAVLLIMFVTQRIVTLTRHH